MTGFEPATPRATVSCSNQLSYTHRKSMFILFLTPRPIRRRYFFEIPLGRTRSEFATPENIKRIHGAPGATRTPDTLLRRQVLYPAELQARSKSNFYPLPMLLLAQNAGRISPKFSSAELGVNSPLPKK